MHLYSLAQRLPLVCIPHIMVWLLHISSPRTDDFNSILIFFFFSFVGLHLRHTEVPRLGVTSELQLPTFATATPGPSCICDLHPQLMAMPDP